MYKKKLFQTIILILLLANFYVPSNVFAQTLSVANYGAVADDSNDDTQAFNSAIAALQAGDTLYIPSGKYLVSQSLKFNKSNYTIAGDGEQTIIEYTYNQKCYPITPTFRSDYSDPTNAEKATKLNADGSEYEVSYPLSQYNAECAAGADELHSKPLFDIENGSSNITIRDLRVTYSGYFGYLANYNTKTVDGAKTSLDIPMLGRVSYAGDISGIMLRQVENVTVDNVVADGFNHAGVALITGCVDPNASKATCKYAKNIKILNSTFKFNRVSGVLMGNGQNVEVANNTFYKNGSYYDPGTGYGFAGTSAETVQDIVVKNNRAIENYRKGIDFHNGRNIQILNNFVDGNRLYGIFVSGNRVNDVLVEGNIVTNMKDPDWAEPGVSPGNIAGIAVGSFGKSTVFHQAIVRKNTITNFDFPKYPGSFAIWLFNSFDGETNGDENEFEVNDNIVNVSGKAELVHMSGEEYFGQTGDSPEAVADRRVKSSLGIKVKISGNQFNAKDITYQPFLLRKFQTLEFLDNSVNLDNYIPSANAVGIVGMEQPWDIKGLTYRNNCVYSTPATAQSGDQTINVISNIDNHALSGIVGNFEATNNSINGKSVMTDGTLGQESLVCTLKHTDNIFLVSADKKSARSGDTISYNVWFMNLDKNSIANVNVADSIPQGTTYVAGSATAGGTLTGKTLKWHIDSLNSNGIFTASFKVRVN